MISNLICRPGPSLPEPLATEGSEQEVYQIESQLARVWKDEEVEALFSQDPVISDAALLDRIVTQGNHVVVMGLSGFVLEPIVRLVRALTSPQLPERFRQVPVVMLYYTEAPFAMEKAMRVLAKACQELVFVNASPLKLESMLLAGIDKCAKLIVLNSPADAGDERNSREPFLLDYQLILLLSGLEFQRKRFWGSLPTLLYQLQLPQNISFISEGSATAGNDAQPLTNKTNSRSRETSAHMRTHIKYASGQALPCKS